MTSFNVILFDGFETLDAFGPVEVIGHLKDLYKLGFYSLNGGVIESIHTVKVHTLPFADIDTAGILFIPGGVGVRKLVAW